MIFAKWFGWKVVLVLAGILYISLVIAFIGLRVATRRTSMPESGDVGQLMGDPDKPDEAEIALRA